MRSSSQSYQEARDKILSFEGDYDRALAEFTWPELGDTFNWAMDWFDSFACDNDANALVIVESDGTRNTTTFDQMRRRSNKVARWLASKGVEKGDSVILMVGNQVELWESMLAVQKLGAVIMPTTTSVGPAELTDRMERGGATHAICNAADTTKFSDIPLDFTRIAIGDADGWHDFGDSHRMSDEAISHPETSPSQRLLLYFTSGTTSRPKLVEHTQSSYPVGHLTTVFWLGIRPGDVHLNISSPGWAKHAWSSYFAPWIAGATILVLAYDRFDPVALLQRIRENGVTTFCAPPTVWRMLIKADLSGGYGALREIIGAGEPLNPEVIAQVQNNWGLTLRDGFGQTEMTAAIGNTPGAVVKSGSMGRPLPGVPVVLVDPLSGQRLSGGGAEGEICLDLNSPSGRPMPLMTGYFGDEMRNKEAMKGGYYHTGDVASIDDDGYITYVGRTDDVFKASDYKISPFELESVLIQHPAVAEVAVVPAPDPVRLAVPKAYVSLTPGCTPDRQTALAILKHARENLAPYLRVRRLEFIDLPKTISGKIRRVELRVREEGFAERHETAPQEWRDDQFDELKTVK